MHRDHWSSSAAGAAAYLAVIAREIQQRGAPDHEVLLTDFLRAAWPTGQAQRQ
ncbi:MAG: hypothetical protein ABI950_14025 [Solirubrobacteraceae bacterium]